MKRIGTALGYIDELIWLLICLAGVAAVVIAIVGGASVIEVGLILMLAVVVAFKWAFSSNVWDWLRGRGS